jgi:hypothetical protein
MWEGERGFTLRLFAMKLKSGFIKFKTFIYYYNSLIKYFRLNLKIPLKV